MKLKILILTFSIATLLFLFLKKSKENLTVDTNNVKIDTLLVGTSADFAPFSFIENNNIVGFDIDIANEIAKQIDKPVQIVNRSFDMLIPEIQMGNIHMIAAGMDATPERKKQVLFSIPYLKAEAFIAISKKNKKISSFEDLKKEEVIVNSGYTSDSFLSQFKDISLKRLPTVSDAFVALNSNQASVFVTAKNTVQQFFKLYGKENYNIYTLDCNVPDTAIAVSKYHPELLKEINEAIYNMELNGTIEKLKHKWNLK